MAVSGIILAGGRSSRMGRDKTLILYKNETLIARTVNELRGVVDDIVIASNHTAKYNLAGVREVPDTYPGMGPLGGLYAGLAAAKYEDAFVVAGDLPFFTGRLAAWLLARKDGYDAVVPRIGGNWEPLTAVYSRGCLGPIGDCLQAGLKKVYQFYPAVRVLAVSEEELRTAGFTTDVFYNLNAPEDLAALCRGNCPDAGPAVSVRTFADPTAADR